jgi:YbbR domain-containing protein
MDKQKTKIMLIIIPLLILAITLFVLLNSGILNKNNKPDINTNQDTKVLSDTERQNFLIKNVSDLDNIDIQSSLEYIKV